MAEKDWNDAIQGKEHLKKSVDGVQNMKPPKPQQGQSTGSGTGSQSGGSSQEGSQGNNR